MAIIDTSLEKESRDRYLTYALSVVSGRALPDVRDGLKPVQRRILYAMRQNLDLTPDRSYRKSAAVVGEVLARFHPHGDMACYEALVRMAQDFSLRYPLIDGQGNFGSLDGDNAAAYRYTEARLRPIALEVIGEIDQETVDFRDNFDGTLNEPLVLPSRVPNLLINGAAGIAVGMATNIPPHNLRETVKALLELSHNPEISNARLAGVIKGPDFPTGCLILNSRKELNDIYKTGRGVVRMRGEWHLEDGPRGKRFVVITSIPYALNKSQLVEKIANLIVEKKVPQLVDIRDESTSEIRIVLELAGGADAQLAMAYLFKNTPLESGFAVNLTALVPTQGGACVPKLLTLRDCLRHFLIFREEVVQRKLQFEKKKLSERIHILQGLVKIYDALDEALKIVRKSEGRSDAAKKLEVRFRLSQAQALAVVDMRIYQLAKTSIEEIRTELAEKSKRVKQIESILKSRDKVLEIVRAELALIAEKYGDKRRSRFAGEESELEFHAEDYIVEEDVYAIVTADGWIKRIRQGNELDSTRLREGDAIMRAHPLSTRDAVAFLTNKGYLYVLKVVEFPSSSGYGEPLQKNLKFRDGERIIESFGVKVNGGKESADYAWMVRDGEQVLLASGRGVGFILKLDGLEGVKRNGKRAIKLRGGDELAAACLCDPAVAEEVCLFTALGSGLRIKPTEIPQRDSAAVGVCLMGIREGDRLVGGFVKRADENPKVILELASGKDTEISLADVVAGRRALKGNKLVSGDEVRRVTVIFEQPPASEKQPSKLYEIKG